MVFPGIPFTPYGAQKVLADIKADVEGGSSPITVGLYRVQRIPLNIADITNLYPDVVSKFNEKKAAQNITSDVSTSKLY